MEDEKAEAEVATKGRHPVLGPGIHIRWKDQSRDALVAAVNEGLDDLHAQGKTLGESASGEAK